MTLYITIIVSPVMIKVVTTAGSQTKYDGALSSTPPKSWIIYTISLKKVIIKSHKVLKKFAILDNVSEINCIISHTPYI